jgi:hypothetical protein
MKRIAVPSTASIKELYDVAYKTLNLSDYGFSLFSDRGCAKELRSSRSDTLASTKLNHGDVIYFKQMAGSSVSSVLTLSVPLMTRNLFLVSINVEQFIKQQFTNASAS